jgi:hypothetical protein
LIENSAMPASIRPMPATALPAVRVGAGGGDFIRGFYNERGLVGWVERHSASKTRVNAL